MTANFNQDGSLSIGRTDRRWTDVLPWLAKPLDSYALQTLASVGDGDWWRRETVHITLARTSSAVLANILAELLLHDETYARMTLQELLPTLPDGVPLAEALNLSVRAHNSLARAGILTTDDVVKLCPADIARWRQVGGKTCCEIIAALIDLAIMRPRLIRRPTQEQTAPALPPTIATMDSSATDVDDPPVPAGDGDRWMLLDAIETLASWQAAYGDDSTPVGMLIWDNAGDLPPEVARAHQYLTATPVRLFAARRGQYDPMGVLVGWLDNLDEREFTILSQRLLAEWPATLHELGARFEVSRERIRQIESKLTEEIEQLLQRHEHDVLPTALRRIQTLSAPVAQLDRVKRERPWLGRPVPRLAADLITVLVRLSGAAESRHGWLAWPDLDAARKATTQLFRQQSGRRAVVPISTLSEALEQWGMHAHDIDSWLSYCGFRRLDGQVAEWRGSVKDKAEIVLLVTGHPMISEEIHAEIGGDGAISSFKNALAIDPRFQRVDRDTWGLVEWGGREYVSIRDLIASEIERHGGTVPLDRLVATLTSSFAVRESSIRAYASSPPFRIRNGLVSHAPRDNNVPRNPPEESRRLFWIDGCWTYRVDITADHLRGSGFPVPVSVASLVGCGHDDELLLSSSYGQHYVRWHGIQPGMGSLRPILEALNANDGDALFVRFETSRDVSFRLLRHQAVAVLGPVQQAVALAGGDPATRTEDAARVLAGALRLPETTTLPAVASTLAHRGDRDLAGLLATGDSPHLPGETAGDVMALLGFSAEEER